MLVKQQVIKQPKFTTLISKSEIQTLKYKGSQIEEKAKSKIDGSLSETHEPESSSIKLVGYVLHENIKNMGRNNLFLFARKVTKHYFAYH